MTPPRALHLMIAGRTVVGQRRNRRVEIDAEGKVYTLLVGGTDRFGKPVWCAGGPQPFGRRQGLESAMSWLLEEA